MKKYVSWIFPILMIGLLSISACQPASQAIESSTSTESMQKIQGIPAIDQSQPDEFATATFSMG